MRLPISFALAVALAGNAAAGKGPIAGKIKTNPQDGLVYVWIPAGNFMMGCSAGDEECFNEEMPEHHVIISKGFWMGQTEVTVHAYEHFAGIARDGEHGSSEPYDNMPAVDVTWDEAQDYCKWAGGRLPTEAEWEYAARAGNTQARYGELDQIAWYRKNSSDSAHQVAQKRANEFGLFDTLGNAWEWVNDWYDGSYYSKSPEIDPAGPPVGALHVLRGGSWMNTSNLLRVSDRGRSNADLRFNYFGVRCALDASAP